MVQVRDLVIGGGNFAVESGTPNPASGFGLGMEMAGSFLEQKMERDADAYNIKAETDLQLFGVEALQKTINEVDNPEEITPKFFETYKAKYDELYQAAPNAIAKDKLSRTYENFRGSFGQRAIMAQAEETQSMRLNNVYDSIERYQSAAINGTIPYAAARQGINDAINGAGNFLPASQSAKLKRTAKQETAKLIVANMPDDVKFKAITSATAEIKGGFDAAMQMVHANEGGFAAVDGASGAPAMMGINKREHKAAYNEVMRINETQGAEAAKAYADKFYKENFWDKNKIGELPENVQTIVMDGVVNHWSGFQKQLLQAARNGASPEELIQMRRKEYERLANSPGEKGDYPWRASAEGWENRMDNLEAGLFGKTGTAIDDLDVADKVRVMQDVREYPEKMAKLKFENPWEYYTKTGQVTPPAQSVVGMQPEQAQSVLEARRNEINQLKAADPTAYLPVLMPQEIEALKNIYKQGTPETITAVITSLGQSLTPEEKKVTVREFAEKEPMVAVAMSLPYDKSVRIVAGDKAKGEVTAEEVRTSVAPKISGITIDAAMNESAHQTIYAYYKQLAIEKGESGKVVNDTLLNQAIKDTLGNIDSISVNGVTSKIIIPDGLTPNQVEDKIETLTDDFLVKTYGELPMAADGSRYTAEEIKEEVQFITAGNGKLALRDPRVGTLFNSKGQPYVIDILGAQP